MTSAPIDAGRLERNRRAVRTWLLAVAALVFAMVVVGGATRLTESGLSIVEWQPVAGALPPASEAQWQAQFEKYKTIPQYQTLNPGMSLEAFKTIFWWEWTHRLLGRLIGVAFLLPFLWFLRKGRVEPRLRGRLWMIFGLGGEAFLAAVERRSFRHGPGQQHAVAFEAKVVMQLARRVLLHDEQQRPAPPRGQLCFRLGGGIESPLGGILAEAVVVLGHGGILNANTPFPSAPASAGAGSGCRLERPKSKAPATLRLRL